MKIKDLPEVIKAVALFRQIEQGNEPNIYKDLSDTDEEFSFAWMNTPEGTDIWELVQCGNFDPFYEFHGLQELDKPEPEPKTEPNPETEFVKGEMVEVSDDGIKWVKKEYFGYNSKSIEKQYHAVISSLSSIHTYKFCRKLQTTFTIEEAKQIISETKGIDKDKITIS